MNSFTRLNHKEEYSWPHFRLRTELYRRRLNIKFFKAYNLYEINHIEYPLSLFFKSQFPHCICILDWYSIISYFKINKPLLIKSYQCFRISAVSMIKVQGVHKQSRLIGSLGKHLLIK